MLTADDEVYYDKAFGMAERIQGFLSGHNVYHEMSVNTDFASVDGWVRKWCEKNPTKQVSTGVAAFIVAHRK